MKKSKTIFLIISMILTISFVIGIFGIRYINKVNKSNTSINTIDSRRDKANGLNDDDNSIDKKSDSRFFRVAGRYGGDDNPSFFELFSTEDSLKRLKAINKRFHENFDYFELEFQQLYYIGHYDGEEKFVNSFGTGIDSINQVVANENGKEIYATDLKTIQLGKKFYKDLENRIHIGNNFSIDDFSVNDSNKTVNIILGYDYLQYYKLGDTINLTLHQKSINFKVIGFYKKDTFISCQGTSFGFDQCIIMPFYDINYDPVDEKDELYQKIYYCQKNEVYIRLPEDIKIDDDDIHKNYLDSIETHSEEFKLLYTLTSMPLSIDLNP
ncbi:MAG: hypothetical protein K0Q99_1882 [Clostridia bacterium]|jgi:hypothetical protein|nr:hypothetical protein [Clostridia bacterium]